MQPNPNSPSNDRWSQLATLLESSDGDCGLKRVFPPESRRISLLEGLESDEVAESEEQQRVGRAIAEKLRGLTGQLKIFEQVSHCPVVAIAGLLNAGKSSLLATYLSPEGRRRVLRGVGNVQGTHRFVIWLPRAWWSDPELLSTLIGLLTNVFGHPPEQLSDDVAEAQSQYNGTVLSQYKNAAHPQPSEIQNTAGETPTQLAADCVNPLAIPLIASDPGLDTIQLALVDCPDIQTLNSNVGLDHPSGSAVSAAATSRRDQLARMGRLCSAFVVVSKMSSLHDEALVQILTALRDSMPGVPRILAINRVKARYSPQVAFSEARLLVDRFGISSVFTAYDYRSALAGPLIPATPPGMVANESEPQPIFTEVTGVNPVLAASLPAQRSPYLYHLSQRLDAGELARESHRSLSLQFQELGSQAIEWLRNNELLQRRQLTAAWKAIADACYEFMAERDADGVATGLRLQASPAILAQMAESLQRTAPTWMRFSMMLDRTARQFQHAVSNSAARFKMLKSASDAVTNFAKSFRRGEGAQAVTADQLAEAIRRADYLDATVRVTDEELVAGCEIAMKRFAEEDKTLLDSTRLDELTGEIWKQMPLNQKIWKATQPVALLTGPLLAAILIPFDGGGSTVLVFASMKELLIATGLAAVLGPTLLGGDLIKILHKEAPWRQLAVLFALVCDSLGVPRPTSEQFPAVPRDNGLQKIQSSSVAVKPLALKSPLISQWSMDSDFQQRLRAALERCYPS